MIQLPVKCCKQENTYQKEKTFRKVIYKNFAKGLMTLKPSKSDLKHSKPHHSQLHANQCELMCIDDDPVFQVVLKGLLGSLGYKVVRALSGDEALELMQSRNHLPDLILLDVEMPTESGYEVKCSFLL